MMIGEKRGDPSYKERRAAAPLFEFQMALMLGSWKTMDRSELCPLTTKYWTFQRLDEFEI